MAVTKQTYTATATWTPSQLADIFRSAFIDAGLMTDWHDSFVSSSIENRVLRVIYDGTKTYGTTFYWFMFSTSGVFLHVATGWNTSTDQPTGTQYLDYYSTSTNSTTNHYSLLASGSNISSFTFQIDRYTSSESPDHSWFAIKYSTTRACFHVLPASATMQSWIDLNKGFYSGVVITSFSTNISQGFASFAGGPKLRREITTGCGLVGSTSSTEYRSTSVGLPLISYSAVGHLSNSSSNYSAGGPGCIFLPVGFSSTNPAYTSNSNPVFYGMPYCPHITQNLPNDFGITFHYATNSFSQGDTFVVNSGVEEWEVLSFSSNSSAVTGASPLFLARTV